MPPRLHALDRIEREQLRRQELLVRETCSWSDTGHRGDDGLRHQDREPRHRRHIRIANWSPSVTTTISPTWGASRASAAFT